MLGLHQPIASTAEMVSAPEHTSILGLLPIALIGRILETLALSGFLNNSQNSVCFGLREIHVSIMMRDVNHDIKRFGHVLIPYSLPFIPPSSPPSRVGVPSLWRTSCARLTSPPELASRPQWIAAARP